MLHNYILEGHKVVRVADLMTWARWMEANHPSKTRVGRTVVAGYTVSTIFLAIDYQFGDGPPILWETMVYDSDRKESNSLGLPGIRDIEIQRCSGSWEQAEEMHERMCEQIRKTFDCPSADSKV